MTNQHRKESVADQSPSRATGRYLFRQQSASAARHRLLGQVCIATPPTTGGTLLVALLSLILLGAVVGIVEVPQRTRAIGVLMPEGGLLRVIASETGRITDLAAKEGMTVTEGQVLMRITSDRNAPGRSPLSESLVRSLRTELTLTDQARLREAEIKAKRISALEKKIALTRDRLARADAEIELQSAQIHMLEARFERIKVLASAGSIAEDLLVQERAGVLQARVLIAGLDRNRLRISQELGDLQSERDETMQATGLDRLHHEIARERLMRQIVRAEVDAGRVVLAPAAGVVARLNAKAGAASRPGQTLMTLYEAEGRLEAWLYLPSDKAGRLRTGQTVQLRLDAYPHEVFGTLEAVITEVSTIALLASEAAVPLAINGPVFEVRASLRAETIDALGSSWPLGPGTSFRADVIRQRYRLYQWLLRSLWNNAEGGPDIAGI